MSDHSNHGGNGIGDWIFSRTGIATAIAIAILAFLIYKGHSAHLLGALPFLLIFSCPLLHIFMHGGHGHHHGGQKPKPNEEDDPTDRPLEHKH